MAFALLGSLLVVLLVVSLAGEPALETIANSLYNSVDTALSNGAGQSINISSGSFTLLYYGAPKPSDYATLANYVLTLINNDRIANGVTSNVSLDFNPAAQQHAYSMLLNDYFSHWDTQGYKPYMRYTIAGGTGAVEENIAFAHQTGQFTSVQAEEAALKSLEYEMVYNDAAHGNEHKYNILDPYHNYVSIGVAYDSANIYLVQDFENKYINWTEPVTLSSSGQVTMTGDFSMSKDIQSVQIFYESLPTALTVAQLGQLPYSGSYTQGTFAGGVPPPGTQFAQGITITPSAWDLSGSSFTISFNMAPMIKKMGPGCYTLYISLPPESSGRPNLMTSLTLFVSNSSV